MGFLRGMKANSRPTVASFAVLCVLARKRKMISRQDAKLSQRTPRHGLVKTIAIGSKRGGFRIPEKIKSDLCQGKADIRAGLFLRAAAIDSEFFDHPCSCRRATIGSTFVARRAGM